MNNTIKKKLKISLAFTLFAIIQNCIQAQKNFTDFCTEFTKVNILTISAVGDIIVHDTQLISAWDQEKQCYNFEPVFSPVKKLLYLADLTIGNLEITLPGKKELYSGYPRFGAPDALITALKNTGIDILATATNHACDKSKLGLIRTIDILEQHGLLHLGTYRTKEEYEENRILIIERNNIKLVFLNYTYGTNGIRIPDGTHVNLINKIQIAEDIALSRSLKPDFILVILHCGEEYLRYPDLFQKKTVEFLFNEGVDIILGSHAHVLQPFELTKTTDKYGQTKSRLVIYSLGNFVSNQRLRYRDGGIIFNFKLKKKRFQSGKKVLSIENIHYIPVWVYVHRTPQKNWFYVLPVFQYLNNDQPLKLSKTAYQKMLTFYRDTITHLKTIQDKIIE